MKKIVRVVGAIIEKEGKILCALRSVQGTTSNYWEFPTGKIKEDESLKHTIEKEILEELNCKIEAEKEPFCITTYEYGKFIIELTTLYCKLKGKAPLDSQYEELIWLNKNHLNSLKWSPENIPVIDILIKQ